MKKKIKKFHRNDFEVEYEIDDHAGISKQYPKVMENPKRHGFIWQSSSTLCYTGIKYIKAGNYEI